MKKPAKPPAAPVEVGQIAPSLPEVLLPYQQRLHLAMAHDQVVVCEKSRRIGMTWGIGAYAVLTAGATKRGGGSDVFYTGYNLEMAREFIDACAMWARSFLQVAAEVGEYLFTEQNPDGTDRAIKAFRITFASGFEIVALCSAPRSLRGKQGVVIVDEAAFHAELAELLKAALALVMWGGRVLIISTHDGVENPFNELVDDVRSGRKPYGLVRVTFAEALADGLYQRICLVRGIPWSAEGEVKWAAEIRDFYGEAGEEELDCVPRRSGGKYIAMSLLEARAVDVPVVRWACKDDFTHRAEELRVADCRAFCDEQLGPILGELDGAWRSFLGEDFGRTGDLTVMWPLVMSPDFRRRTPFVLELRNVPFQQQEQILRYIIDRLPSFAGAALDSRGNGQFLAERATQIYGPCCQGIALSEGWYREHMPPMKAALEDDTLSLPRDADILDDLRSLEVVRGVARVPDRPRQTKTGQRHGDGAVALVLAQYASRCIDIGPLEFSAGPPLTSHGAFAGDSADSHSLAGWDLRR